MIVLIIILVYMWVLNYLYGRFLGLVYNIWWYVIIKK